MIPSRSFAKIQGFYITDLKFLTGLIIATMNSVKNGCLTKKIRSKFWAIDLLWGGLYDLYDCIEIYFFNFNLKIVAETTFADCLIPVSLVSRNKFFFVLIFVEGGKGYSDFVEYWGYVQ